MANRRNPKPEDENSLSGLILRETRPADVDMLPENVRRELAKYQTRELVGVAPKWEYSGPGDTLVGRVIKAGSHMLPPRGNQASVESIFLTFESPSGPQTLWLSADLKIRFAVNSLADAERHVGRCYCVWYKGELTKKDNPRLINDMHLFGVIEVLPPNAETPANLESVSS